MRRLAFLNQFIFNRSFKKRLYYAFIGLLTFSLTGCSLQSLLTYGASSQSQGVFAIPQGASDLIGQTYTVTAKPGETLQSIGMRYDVGEVEMRQANPTISSWKPIPSETQVIIPTQYILPPKQYRHGIVINIAELRLYYFDQPNQLIMTFPIALGREGWRTPIGKTYVARKQENPSWYPPKSIREYTYQKTGKMLPAVVQPGPGNPLGHYAIYLGMSGYLIHGTNDHDSIGKQVSSGCIRLHNKDIAKFFYKVTKGTPVYIIYYPNKIGRLNDRLYLESQKPITHDAGLYAQHEIPIHTMIQKVITNESAAVNWDAVHAILVQRTGIPQIIGNVGD